jgi:outer membrane protein assembly factor BamB
MSPNLSPIKTDAQPWYWKIGDQDWVMVCDLLTGEELREWSVDDAYSGHCLFLRGDAGPEVVVGYSWEGPRKLCAYDADTGTRLWEFPVIKEPAESNHDWGFTSFSIVRNTLFAGGWDVGPNNHPIPLLYQFDLRTGDVLWSLIGEPKRPH